MLFISVYAGMYEDVFLPNLVMLINYHKQAIVDQHIKKKNT